MPLPSEFLYLILILQLGTRSYTYSDMSVEFAPSDSFVLLLI
jgi:hypothetical protein